jgi:anti-sigma-K factor RskA
MGPERRFPWLWIGIALIGFVMTAGFGSYVAGLMKTINEQDERLAQLGSELGRTHQLAEILGSDDLVVVSLNSHEHDVWGNLFWSPGRKHAMVRVSGLDSLREYHLWLLEKEEPSRFSMFSVPSRQTHLIALDTVLEEHADPGSTFVVTMDQQQGMSKPTGPMILAGALVR